jgi:hypothetical protein
MGVLDFLRLPAVPYVNKASVRNWLLNIEPPDDEEPALLSHFADPNYYDQEPPPEPSDLPPQEYLVPVHPPEVMTKYDYSSFNVTYARWDNPYEQAVVEEPSYNETTDDILVTEIASTPFTRKLGPVQHASPNVPDIDEYLDLSASEDEADDRMHRRCKRYLN